MATEESTSRLMPNIYYLGFKTGQAMHYLSNYSASRTSSNLPTFDQVLQWIYDIPTCTYIYVYMYIYVCVCK